MAYEVRIARSLHEIDPVEWDSLNASVPFAGWKWLKLVESLYKSYEPRYVLLYERGRLVGRALANFSQQTDVPISSAWARRVVQAVLARHPLLVCQTPIANSGGLLLPRGDEPRALSAIYRALSDVAREGNTSFTILGWLKESEKRIIEPKGGYRFLQMDRATTLHIRWRTFEDYTASLGKSMRKDMRRHNNRAADLSIAVERVQRYTQHSAHLSQLMKNVLVRHGSLNADPYAANALAAFERDLPNNSIMLLARAGEEIAGCGLLLHDQGVMGLAMLGLDYTHQYVYFQLFYEAIRCAIESGMSVIRGGSGAYEFKQRLGFCEEPIYVGFYAHWAVFRWLGSWLTQAMDTAQPTQVSAEAG